MKSRNPLLFFLVLVFLTACSKKTTIVVTNPSLLERYNTMAEISAQELNLTPQDSGKFILLDEDKRQVPYQVLYAGEDSPQKIIFLVDDIRGGMQRQVIAVSHLPQIAAMGDAHFYIEKTTDGTETKTGIRRLPEEERSAELARMFGGETRTQAALKSAEEMLAAAKRKG